MLRRASGLSKTLLGLLVAAALVPGAILAYWQYKSVLGLEEQTRQALIGNLQQGLVGVRVESSNDFAQWLRTALSGVQNHDWLARRDLERIETLAVFTRKICPHLGLFFAARNRGPGQPPEVFVFRPGPDRQSMDLNEADGAVPEIPNVLASLRQTPNTLYYAFYGDIDGDRHQIFVHRVDQQPEAGGHWNRNIGYYGFAIPTRVLAQDYFPEILKKHLARLASNRDSLVGEPVGAVYDETNRLVCASKRGAPAQLVVSEQLDQEYGVLPGWTIQAGFVGDPMGPARAQLMRRLGLTLAITAVMLSGIVLIGIAAAREMRLSRAKSEFVASVSHELKTPLSLIRGFAETLHLNRLPSPSDREEYFRIIETEILRLSLMIDRILEFSKIEVGLKQYQPEMTDVAGIVEETLGHFSYELEKGGFQVERHIEEPRPLAPVDPHAFSQALLNLLSNAIKYSDAERFIGVRVARNNGHVEVSISDHGIGIPRSEQDRVFEKFYRTGAGAAKTNGAGLGLALVKHFAESHGGSVRVASSAGKGSTFTILLPAEAAKN
jgi:signal transduction histidine kinase